MTADGGYLSGRFARQSNSVARDTLTRGLDKWKQIVHEKGHEPKPVPTDSLDLYGGEPLQKGGLKLEVAYRDFPRGDDRRPGDARFPNPYNLGWFDFSPAEARALLEEGEFPAATFRKFACQVLKDAVRGQMGDWKENDFKNGKLVSQLTDEDGSVKTYAISGSAEFEAGERSFKPEFFGSASFDTASGEFTDFRFIAAGQRTGKGGANGRETDLGPAPIGIGFKLYQSKE
ncbi:MAG: hypothetical protein AAF585_26540 [Verrucomicrobiota bacterium]